MMQWAEDPLTPGTMLAGRYRVLRLLDRGPASRRYLAEEPGTGGGPVAVQELSAAEIHHPDDRARVAAWLDQTVERLHALHHPALAPVLAGWADPNPDGAFYLAVRHVPGPSLAEEMAEAGGAVPWRQAVDWALAICDLLSYLHDRRPPVPIGHLRPRHLVLDSRTGSPVLIDVGLAPALAGRPWDNGGYTPLEQYISRPSPRSDLYALGAMLHTLLGGLDPDMGLAHRLREGQDLQRALRGLFPPLQSRDAGLPPDLTALVARATAFVAEDRFPDAQAMAGALRGLLGPAVSAGTALPDAVQEEPVWQQLGLSRDAWFALTPRQRSAELLKLVGRRATPQTPHTAPSPAPVSVAAPVPRPAAEMPVRLRIDVHGAGTYREIGPALAAAAPGTHLDIAPGHYAGALRIDRAVELRGPGSATPAILESTAGGCLRIVTDGVVVRGLALRQAGDRIPAVECAGKDVVLEDCVLEGGAPAILVRGAGSVLTMRRCVLQEGSAAGLRVEDGATAILEDCAIGGCGGPGARIEPGSRIEARHCVLRDGEGPGLDCADGAHGLVESCEIVGNAGHGIAIGACEGLTIRACRVGYNGGAAVAAGTGAAGTIEGCDLTGNVGGPWQWPGDDPSAAPLLVTHGNRE